VDEGAIVRLPRDRKDGVMCKVGIIDYSLGGVFWVKVVGAEGGRGEEDEKQERKGRKWKDMREKKLE
jgi:hypothetical protein